MKIPEGADAYFFDDIDLVVLMFPKKYEDVFDRDDEAFYCVDITLYDARFVDIDEATGGVVLDSIEDGPFATGRVFISGELELNFKGSIHFSDAAELEIVSKWLRRCHERASEYFPD